MSLGHTPTQLFYRLCYKRVLLCDGQEMLICRLLSGFYNTFLQLQLLHLPWPAVALSLSGLCPQDDVTASKLAAYSTMEEAAKRHWSAILFVTRKMTALGLDALYKSTPCLKAWRAATLVGYGGSLASSCLTSKVAVKALVSVP